jgi:hypothetical protein
LSWKWVWAPFLKKTNLWRKQNRKKKLHLELLCESPGHDQYHCQNLEAHSLPNIPLGKLVLYHFISGLVDRLCSNNISSLWWTWLFHTGTSLLLWYPNSRSAYYALIKKERNSTKTAS